jgi:hypothetical protein
MGRHLAAKICRFCVADLRNSPLLRVIHAPKEVPLEYALNRHILIDNLFGPDLFRGSLNVVEEFDGAGFEGVLGADDFEFSLLHQSFE